MIRPSWEQINKCLDIYEDYKSKIDKLEEVIGILAPSSYTPIIDFHNPLDVMDIFIDENTKDRIEYYLYECSMMDNGGEITYKGKEYIMNYGDRESLKNVLLAFKYITI